MDELNITPQPTGEQPEENPGDEAVKPAQEEQGAFSLDGKQKTDAKPSIEDSLLQPNQGAEASAEAPPEPAPAMEKQSNPAQFEAPASAAEDTPAPGMSSLEEEPEENSTQETAPAGDSAITTDEAPSKGGIPKWAMIAGGVIGVGAIAVVAMFITDTGPFKGQLVAPEVIDRIAEEQVLAPSAPAYCPDGQYYDAGDTTSQNRLQLLDDSMTGDTQQNLRLLNALPSAKAQTLDTRVLQIDSVDVAPSDTLELNTDITTTYTGVNTEPLPDININFSLNATEEPAPVRVLTATQEEVPPVMALTATQEEEPSGFSINTESTRLEVNTATFDRTKCKQIPQQDCALLSKLMETPDAYYISPTTLDSINNWKNQNCAEPETPVVVTEVKTCGENQKLDTASNQCACVEGYFELESATNSADATRILDQAGDLTLATNNEGDQATLMLLDDSNSTAGFPINNTSDGTRLTLNTPQMECINCAELNSRIEVLKTRLNGLESLDITAEQRATQESVLTAEIERLEAKASKENCGTPTIVTRIPETTFESRSCDQLVAQIVEIQGYTTTSTTPEIAQELATLVTQARAQECEIPEKDACTALAEESSNKISLGDFAGSFDQQISYIDASCIRTLDTCDSKIAYATVAKEYRSLSTESDDVNFFQEEFTVRRDDYMNDLSCVPDKQLRCTDIEGQLTSGRVFNENGNLVQAANLEPLNGVDEPETLVLDSALLDAAPINNILTLDETSDTTLSDNNTLTLREGFTRETNLLSQTNLNQQITANLESRNILNDREYYDLYCQPFSAPIINDISPVSPIAPEPPEDAPTPEEELAAASSPQGDFQAPAAPSPDSVDTGATIITPPAPPSDTAEETEIAESEFAAPTQPGEPEVIISEAEFHPGAPEEMPSITESPEMTKTGPEAYVAFFILVASQIFYFRRRIYAFLKNRQ